MCAKTSTSVVNVKSVGWDVDEYIGRGNSGKNHLNNTDVGESGWLGNPYVVGKDGSRMETIRKYGRDFIERIVNDDEFAEAVRELEGKTLGCWCKPKDCHGDVIAEFLNK